MTEKIEKVRALLEGIGISSQEVTGDKIEAFLKTKAGRSFLRKLERATEDKPVSKSNSKKQCRSLAAIARLLDCEGINEYAAQHVMRYARSNVLNPTRYDNAKRKFGDVMRGLTNEQCTIIGKFIHLQVRGAMESGLRLGLASYVTLKEGEEAR